MQISELAASVEIPELIPVIVMQEMINCREFLPPDIPPDIFASTIPMPWCLHEEIVALY